MLLKPLLFLLGAIALICIALWLTVWAARRFLLKPEDQVDAGSKCVCGYLLRGLAVPRCPECGRAAGFDKTFEEMGIQADEIKKAK